MWQPVGTRHHDSASDPESIPPQLGGRFHPKYKMLALFLIVSAA